MSENDLVLIVDINGSEVGFTDDGHFETDDTKLVKKMGDVIGTVVGDNGEFKAGVVGWDIIVLCTLLDPDFKVIYADDMIDKGDIEIIRSFVINH